MPELRDGSARVMLVPGCRLNALWSCRSKMEKQETCQHRRLYWHRLSACFRWLGKHPEVVAQDLECGQLVRELHFHLTELAAVFDKFHDLETVECLARVLGQLFERQHEVPLVVEEGAGVGEGDSGESPQSLLEQDVVAMLDAVLVDADFFENPFVLKQPVGVHRRRRDGVASADSGLCAIPIFEVFNDEALLAGIEVRPVYDYVYGGIQNKF